METISTYLGILPKSDCMANCLKFKRYAYQKRNIFCCDKLLNHIFDSGSMQRRNFFRIPHSEKVPIPSTSVQLLGPILHQMVSNQKSITNNHQLGKHCSSWQSSYKILETSE